MVERLFLTVPRGCLQFVIVVFPDHTHLLFFLVHTEQDSYDVPHIQNFDIQYKLVPSCTKSTFITTGHPKYPVGCDWLVFRGL